MNVSKHLLLLLVLVAPLAAREYEVPEWNLYATQIIDALEGVDTNMDNDVVLFNQQVVRLDETNNVFAARATQIAAAIACINGKFSTLTSDYNGCTLETQTIIDANLLEKQDLLGQLELLRQTTTAEILRLTGLRDTAQTNLTQLQDIYNQVTAGYEDLAIEFIEKARVTAEKYDAMVVSKQTMLDKINDLIGRINTHNSQVGGALDTAATANGCVLP